MNIVSDQVDIDFDKYAPAYENYPFGSNFKLVNESIEDDKRYDVAKNLGKYRKEQGLKILKNDKLSHEQHLENKELKDKLESISRFGKYLASLYIGKDSIEPTQNMSNVPLRGYIVNHLNSIYQIKAQTMHVSEKTIKEF